MASPAAANNRAGVFQTPKGPPTDDYINQTPLPNVRSLTPSAGAGAAGVPNPCRRKRRAYR